MLTLARMTRSPGTYALVLHCGTEQTITVGRLGVFCVRPGYYVYVGSAQGPGGLAARLRHHLRPAARPHWHIDYLRAVTAVVDVWYTCARGRYEHAWAQALLAMPSVTVPLPGFGASDCQCVSHLVYVPFLPLLDWLEPQATKVT